MKKLSSKERLTRLFNGQVVDRIPIWLLFPYFPSNYYANVWEIPAYKPILKEVYNKTDFIERREFGWGFCYNSHPDIIMKKNILKEDNKSIEESMIEYKNIRLTSLRLHGSDTVINPFIKKINDLEKILMLPYQKPKPDIDWFLEEKKKLGQNGLMGISIKDSLSIFHELVSEDDFLLWCFENTDKVMDFLDVISKRIIIACQYLLENDIGDIYWISGAEFATPPMLSPGLFDKLVVKYLKPLVDLIHDYNKWVMLHCHGNIKQVLRSIKKINVDALHPIEAPPMGDCTLSHARKELGSNIILTGNIQYGDLWGKNEEEIENLVLQAIKEGTKQGPFILSTTAGPSNPDINKKVINNYFKIIETALNY